jgi:hypothetical protein
MRKTIAGQLRLAESFLIVYKWRLARLDAGISTQVKTRAD